MAWPGQVFKHESDQGRRMGAHCALVPPARPGGCKRSVDVREVLNAIFYVLAPGCHGTPFQRIYRPSAPRIFKGAYRSTQRDLTRARKSRAESATSSSTRSVSRWE